MTNNLDGLSTRLRRLAQRLTDGGHFDHPSAPDVLEAAERLDIARCERYFDRLIAAADAARVAAFDPRFMWNGVPLWEDDAQVDGGVFVFQPSDPER